MQDGLSTGLGGTRLYSVLYLPAISRPDDCANLEKFCKPLKVYRFSHARLNTSIPVASGEMELSSSARMHGKRFVRRVAVSSRGKEQPFGTCSHIRGKTQ